MRRLHRGLCHGSKRIAQGLLVLQSNCEHPVVLCGLGPVLPPSRAKAHSPRYAIRVAVGALLEHWRRYLSQTIEEKHIMYTLSYLFIQIHTTGTPSLSASSTAMCIPTGNGSSIATHALRSAMNSDSSSGGRNRTRLNVK